MPDPLLVTLALDPGSTARLDELRRQHFPAGRTAVGAHVMLFHALPDTTAVARDAADVARATDAFDVALTRLRSLGRGVALDLAAPQLLAVHTELSRRWAADLTRQDRQRYCPHVTVQNKVTAAVARQTLDRLQTSFAPWTARAVGLQVWVYRGGPWEARARVPFA